MSADPVEVAAPARLGEGPLWDPVRARLMWVDLLASTVHEFDPATGHDAVVEFDRPVAALALLSGGDGYLVAAGLEVAVCAWPSPRLRPVAGLDRGERANDGAVDPAGRFVVGTMADEATPGQAALYSVAGVTARVVVEGVTISNGLDWSPDGMTMYYVDTPLERVDAFDYDIATGALSRRRVLADLRDVPGRPDGLTVDAEGGVWVAMARGGAAVRRFAPDGRADHVVGLPVPNATSVAFGGPDLGDLYVTTSQLRMTEDDLRTWPSAGALFRVDDLGVTGRPPVPARVPLDRPVPHFR
ncbi:SMP-30/gluconolactonase/LRE family protein [Jiangella asiatica]|uniref:SMP-30/gluconolactonase/LRE family protein n=1 Tax=Jiangella asiatica TaxID=2530372 RepID=UPI0013A5CAB8|nr:SMP-30/gluconolactonase/LRE family protein [Jiangella asiatica]